jgi:hypothetical protein
LTELSKAEWLLNQSAKKMIARGAFAKRCAISAAILQSRHQHVANQRCRADRDCERRHGFLTR